MILTFLKKAPTTTSPGYQFLCFLVEENTTHVTFLTYEDSFQLPEVQLLREITGNPGEQLAVILDTLHREDFLDPFLTTHNFDLEDWILSHLVQNSSPVSEEAPLVSQSPVN
jgi:hypothetical protein